MRVRWVRARARDARLFPTFLLGPLGLEMTCVASSTALLLAGPPARCRQPCALAGCCSLCPPLGSGRARQGWPEWKGTLGVTEPMGALPLCPTRVPLRLQRHPDSSHCQSPVSPSLAWAPTAHPCTRTRPPKSTPAAGPSPGVLFGSREKGVTGRPGGGGEAALQESHANNHAGPAPGPGTALNLTGTCFVRWEVPLAPRPSEGRPSRPQRPGCLPGPSPGTWPSPGGPWG